MLPSSSIVEAITKSVSRSWGKHNHTVRAKIDHEPQNVLGSLLRDGRVSWAHCDLLKMYSAACHNPPHNPIWGTYEGMVIFTKIPRELFLLLGFDLLSHAVALKSIKLVVYTAVHLEGTKEAKSLTGSFCRCTGESCCCASARHQENPCQLIFDVYFSQLISHFITILGCRLF